MTAVRAALILMALAAGARAAHDQGQAMTDDELLQAIDRAVAERVHPAQAAARVGAPPWVDTSHGPAPANYLRNLNTDAGAPAPLPRAIAKARALVFWKRPLDASDPRVVGIYWPPEGAPARFFVVVRPN